LIHFYKRPALTSDLRPGSLALKMGRIIFQAI